MSICAHTIHIASSIAKNFLVTSLTNKSRSAEALTEAADTTIAAVTRTCRVHTLCAISTSTSLHTETLAHVANTTVSAVVGARVDAWESYSSIASGTLEARLASTAALQANTATRARQWCSRTFLILRAVGPLEPGQALTNTLHAHTVTAHTAVGALFWVLTESTNKTWLAETTTVDTLTVAFAGNL